MGSVQFFKARFVWTKLIFWGYATFFRLGKFFKGVFKLANFLSTGLTEQIFLRVGLVEQTL